MSSHLYKVSVHSRTPFIARLCRVLFLSNAFLVGEKFALPTPCPHSAHSVQASFATSLPLTCPSSPCSPTPSSSISISGFVSKRRGSVTSPVAPPRYAVFVILQRHHPLPCPKALSSSGSAAARPSTQEAGLPVPSFENNGLAYVDH